MKQPLILTGDGYQISLTKEAEKLRSELIKSAQGITRVNDKNEETEAISEASNLQAFIKSVESTRVAVKQPVLELGKKIDRIAAEAVDAAKAQVNRIKGLLGVYQEKLAAERRKIEEEARRKQEEADKALREAEAARLAAERKNSLLAETKAERAEVKAVEKRVEVMELKQQAEATKVKGGRMEIDFEVVDAAEFYNEHPELCTLIIKTRETKEYLKMRASREKIECPQEHGLRVFLKPVISVR